ncbi:MAG TPA: HIT family protein [Burkholderiaceae bacterium]|nr:HIT family protein [Burkholderiaceae bacterium]
MSGSDRATTCPFCDRNDAIGGNEHAYMLYDLNPVTPGHLLVVTVRHVADFFATTRVEREAMLQLVDEAKMMLDRTRAPSGYNLGVNVGAAAGQTIMHVHVHVIPRYPGDTPNPRGGVRGVISARQSY